MIAQWIRKGILKARRMVRNERGALAVEFALTAPFFLILIIGILDLGRLFWVKNIMQFSVEQTARYAMVNPSSTAAALVTYADTKAGTMFSGITFNADAPGTDVVGGINYRTISASYSFDYYIPIISLNNIPLNSSTRIPVNTP